MIEFKSPLVNAYSGETAVLYGNVVKATHGETVKDETLGSGDGAQASQSFALKKAPVTFTPDKRASRGALTLLSVSVDGVKWTEAPNFFNSKPNDRIFVTAIDEKDVLHIDFGDGEHGARLPSGASNVHAHYRKGWGKAGSVSANSLPCSCKTRPKAVTNPSELRLGRT